MSSPKPNPSAIADSHSTDPPQPNMDGDAEMEDQTQDNTSTTIQNTSSGTLEGDSSTQQQANSQPQAGATTTYSQQNRKDVSLREFLSRMDDYAPIIPDAVTSHYLTVSGLPPPTPHDPSGATTSSTPLPLARLLALATQKFISDIATDAYQFSRIRASNTAAANNPLGTTGLPGQVGGIGGAGLGPGGAGGKGGQSAAQLGVQRAGYGGGGQGGSGQGKTVLTMEDLGMAVHEYGVNVKRGEFYR